MATELTAEQQYELVYQGITAVAARCDGAQSEDGVGFNGQDTHFGRRVAMVPFSQWTDEVKVEAARISLTYKVQIMTYTDTDMGTLDVVREANNLSVADRDEAKYAARNQARGYEHKAKNADKLALRKVDAVDGKLALSWHDRDPEKQALVAGAKALPGRKFDWDRKANIVPVSPAVEDFILAWDFPTITDAAMALLKAPQPETPDFWNVTLADNGEKVVIDIPNFNFDTMLAPIKALPGRSYAKATKTNTADVSTAVLAFVAQFNLDIHPDAQYACEHAQDILKARDAAALALEDVKVVMQHVSRQKDPMALPPVFLDMLAHVLPADIAERVIVR